MTLAIAITIGALAAGVLVTIALSLLVCLAIASAIAGGVVWVLDLVGGGHA